MPVTERSPAPAFALISDKGGTTDYGKTSMGIQRSTFVIDAGGYTTKVFRNVKPDTLAEKVLSALAAL